MSQPISFPLSTPPVQAAERLQTQIQHAPENLQHALAGKAEKNRQEQAETVNESSETENPVVDQEGHQGQEYEAGEREGESSPDPNENEQEADSSEHPDEDDMQGRFINVVV